MNIPAGIQVGTILGGIAIVGLVLWLRSHRGDGTPRVGGVPSPFRDWIRVLVLVLAGLGVGGALALSGVFPFGGALAAPGGAEESPRGVLAAPAPERVRLHPAVLPIEPHPGQNLARSEADSLPRRPFLHSQHEAVTCSTCHGTGEAHRVTRIETARDCAACHHDAATLRAYECENCHGPPDMPGPLRVHTTLDLSAWIAPRDRELTFEHALHSERVCQDCHTGPVLLAVETECASCHEEHHRPEAECAACHLPAEPDAHDAQVHLTCTTSGCHSEARVVGDRPELSRPLCLLCHEEQRDHEPERDCAGCHMIPASPVRITSSRRGRPRGGSGS